MYALGLVIDFCCFGFWVGLLYLGGLGWVALGWMVIGLVMCLIFAWDFNVFNFVFVIGLCLILGWVLSGVGGVGWVLDLWFGHCLLWVVVCFGGGVGFGC